MENEINLDYKYMIVCFDDEDCYGIESSTLARTVEEVEETVAISLDDGYDREQIKVYQIEPVEFGVETKVFVLL